MLYPDIYNFIFHDKSAKTLEELKTYKSLEAYNEFVCSWLEDVTTSGQQDSRGCRKGLLKSIS